MNFNRHSTNINEAEWTAFLQVIKSHDEFVLIGHIAPDGDAIGSTLALQSVLEALGKRVHVICDGDPPRDLLKLKGIEKFTRYQAKDFKSKLNSENYVAIAVDCADRSRLGSVVEFFDASPKKMVLDHHVSNHGFAEISVIDGKASATAEIVFHIADALGVTLSQEIATYIYVAIMSDTGALCYSNTSGHTMRVMGDLLDTGIDMPQIQRELFSTRSLKKTRLIALCLDGFSIHFDGKMSLRIISGDELRKNDLVNTDSNGVIEFLRDIEGVEVAAYARQLSNGFYKISLRSQGGVDVAEISLNYEGGGHERAAGFTWKGTEIEPLREAVLKELGAALGYDEERCEKEICNAKENPA